MTTRLAIVSPFILLCLACVAPEPERATPRVSRASIEPEPTATRSILLVERGGVWSIEAQGDIATPEPEPPDPEPEPPAPPEPVGPPAWAFPGPFEDAGPLLAPNWLHEDVPVYGSDPWVAVVDGTWHLAHTWGPSLPNVRMSPAIFWRTADSPLGPWTLGRYVVLPRVDPAAPNRPVGIETFCALRTDSGWLSVVHDYTIPPTGKRNVLRVVTADALGGLWRDTETVIAPELPWERGTDAANTPQHPGQGHTVVANYSEPSLVHLPDGALGLLYAAKSDLPDGVAWRIGFARSTDGGVTWQKRAEPLIVPPGRVGQGAAINAASHVSAIADPRGGYHIFAAWGGNVPPDRKGIAHWFTWDFEELHAHPDTLVWPQGFRFGSQGEPLSAHVGGPSAVFDGDAGVLRLFVHDEGRPEERRRHIRMLVAPFSR